MTEDDALQPLLDELAADPAFAEAAQEHAEGTSCTPESECWGCNTKRAVHSLAHWEEDDPMEFALMECDDLESTLRTVAEANRAIQFLSGVAFHAAMFAFANEFDDEDHDCGNHEDEEE